MAIALAACIAQSCRRHSGGARRVFCHGCAVGATSHAWRYGRTNCATTSPFSSSNGSFSRLGQNTTKPTICPAVAHRRARSPPLFRNLCTAAAIPPHPTGTSATHIAAMARPRKDVKFAHRSASNGRTRRASMSMSDISETGSQPGSPTRNGAVDLPVRLATLKRRPPLTMPGIKGPRTDRV